MRTLISTAALALLLVTGCGSPVAADQASTITTPECAGSGTCTATAEQKAACEAEGKECTAEQKAECAEKKACCADEAKSGT